MLDRHFKNVYYIFMEIRVLKYFLAVAREGTITGAANSFASYPADFDASVAGFGNGVKAKTFNTW